MRHLVRRTFPLGSGLAVGLMSCSGNTDQPGKSTASDTASATTIESTTFAPALVPSPSDWERTR